MTTQGPEGEAGLARNLQLLPAHHALSRAFVWIPVFVLFTRARFDLDGALLLASLYYLFVVALEVPSGWMSDRLGRVVTLRLAAVCFVGAQASFLLGDDRFLVILLGQLLLAAGFASLSGTDVSFHYDSLEALGRADEYTRRQARLSAFGFSASAISAVLGGVLGFFELRLAFAASLAFAVGQLAVTFQLYEPPATVRADPLIAQLNLCFAYLRSRLIAWIFLYGTILVTLEHVAFTLMQPWLTEVLGHRPDDVRTTPLVAGATFAVVSFVGAGAARLSAPLQERFSTASILLGLAALSATIVTGMALWVSAAMLALVALRSVQGAAAPVLISSVLAPRLEQRHRATVLSLNSLAGRLGYGALLYVLADRAGEEVQPVLRILAVISWSLVAVLVVTALIMLDGMRTEPSEPAASA